MSRATLIGVTKLNTAPWKRGMKTIKNGVRRFKREVAEPFNEAANNMARVARNAAIAGGIISTMGSREAFKFESLETQFEMLYRNTKKAKQHVKFLADLSAVTPFDVEPFIQAARILKTMGGEALNNKKFITQMGDASAMAGQDISRVAEWAGRLFNDLKANIGTGRGGRMLMISGIIKPETLTKLQEMTKAGVAFQDRWALVTKELDQAKGSMFRLSRTGNGLFSTMRGLIKLGAAKYFKAFSDKIKNVVYKINDVLNKLYQNGTFEKWGQSIANTTGSIINKVWQIVKAWQNLNTNTRSQLKNMVLAGTAAAAAWKAGLIIPVMKATYGMTAFVIRNFKHIAAGASVLATAIAGYKLGNILYNSFSGNGKSSLQKIASFFQTILKVVSLAFTQIMMFGQIAGEELWKGLTGGQSNFKARFKMEMDAHVKDTKKIIDDAAKQMNAIDEYDRKNPGKKGKNDFYKNFQSELKKEFDPAKMWGDLKKITVPKALQTFFKEFKKMVKFEIKFPEMPKLAPLDDQLDTKGAMDNIDKLKSKMSNVPIRGIYAKLGSFKANMSPATALAAAKSTKTDKTSKAMDKSVSLAVSRNSKLESISSTIADITTSSMVSVWG